MDKEDFRSILRSSGVDLWTFIGAAIDLASSDYGPELKNRRDGIVERLYAAVCRNCCPVDPRPSVSDLEVDRNEASKDGDPTDNGRIFGGCGRGDSPATPQSLQRGGVEDAEVEEDLGKWHEFELDKNKSRILAIKQQIDDPDQTEGSLINLLHCLMDMGITFEALQETEIGRHIKSLKKHPSVEVRRLAKQLIIKWKEIVDEWVKSNSLDDVATASVVAGCSQQAQKRCHQEIEVADSLYSSDIQNGNMSSDRNKSKLELKEKVTPWLESDTKQNKAPSTPVISVCSRNANDAAIDMERLASASKRLHANYKEAEKAKRQRTVQVMDLHDLPKPKNSFFPRQRGGYHGRHS